MDENPDIVAIGVEELVDLNASNIVKARLVYGNIQTNCSIRAIASVDLCDECEAFSQTQERCIFTVLRISDYGVKD